MTVKPEIEFPYGDPPTELDIVDISEGDGAEAKPGQTVRVHYVGVAFSTGEEFDASWNRGDPLEFQLGAGRVISGWDQGLVGMKVGGRRQLTIPPRPGVRRPRRRRRDQAGRDADLRLRPGRHPLGPQRGPASLSAELDLTAAAASAATAAGEPAAAERAAAAEAAAAAAR